MKNGNKFSFTNFDEIISAIRLFCRLQPGINLAKSFGETDKNRNGKLNEEELLLCLFSDGIRLKPRD